MVDAVRSIVGDLINFRGLVYAPVNENGVVFLFGKVAEDLNMYVLGDPAVDSVDL